MDFPNMSVCSQKRNVGSVWKIGGHTQLTRGNQNIHSSWKIDIYFIIVDLQFSNFMFSDSY